MNVLLIDSKEWKNLRPLTLTKPFGELRMGILTFRERWQKMIEADFSYWTEEYLSEKFKAKIENVNLFINPAYFPEIKLIEKIKYLNEGEILTKNGQFIAGKLSLEDFKNWEKKIYSIDFSDELVHINQLWDLFGNNDFAIRFDFELLTKGRKSQPISATNGVRNSDNIFLEEGAVVEFSVLNADSGPIYI